MRPKNIAKEDAIRRVALQIIAEEGLEHLSMQKLAKAAGVSPRTIYIKYTDKEDFLVKLFIDEVLAAYEKATLENFHADMDLEEGVKRLWWNGFRYLTTNRPAFALIQYGKSSPLLNKAYQERDIREGYFFAPILRFLERQVAKGIIQDLPQEVLRALLFSPLFDLAKEYFDYLDRPAQIITERLVETCCDVVIKGIRL